MRSNARWTNSRSRSRSIRCELRLQCYSDRDQNTDLPYSSKQLRECYRQGAAAFGWDKRNPEPRSMRDGSDLVGWGMATGVWEALQMPAAVRIVLTANGHAEVARRPPISAPAPTRSWRRSRPTCLACRSTTSASSSAIRRCRNRRSKADRGSRPRCATRSRRRPARFARSCCIWRADAEFAAGRRDAWTTLRWRTARSSASGMRAARSRSPTRCGTATSIASSRRRPTSSRKTAACAQHPLGDLRRGQGGRAARRHPRHPRRQRGRGRAHPQHQDRPQPGHGRRGVGHRHGAA